MKRSFCIAALLTGAAGSVLGQSGTPSPSKKPSTSVGKKVVYCVTGEWSDGARITYVNATGGVESATAHTREEDSAPAIPGQGVWSKMSKDERENVTIKALLAHCAWSYIFVAQPGTVATLEATNGHGWVTVEARAQRSVGSWVYALDAVRSEATTYDDLGTAIARIKIP